MQHLFIDYQFSKLLWLKVMNIFNEDTMERCILRDIERVARIDAKKNNMAKLYAMVWTDLQYAIWISRCKMVYSGRARSVENSTREAFF